MAIFLGASLGEVSGNVTVNFCSKRFKKNDISVCLEGVEECARTWVRQVRVKCYRRRILSRND